MANADRIIDLLHEAKAHCPGAERDRFLDEACAGDAALKEQIVSLLEAGEDESESGFLEIPRIARPPLLPTEQPGDRVGRYKLLEQIGEGGCGVVYMAEQEEPVRRRVALKVIKLGMDTKSVIARFDAERQALAMMDHPNIAKVLDAGATDAGRPYFVMELVYGVRITDYCDQANLPTVERLALFIQVCHAVQHAHQKGIIHRDLKPSNILVTLQDEVPVPKVIDFGVAKAAQERLTDLTLYTQLQQIIGTPLYMSPEQAEGNGHDVDTRTDIYALGVLLYELLTGRTPFDAETLHKAGYDEMRRVIREQEPQKPSTALDTMARAVVSYVAQHRASEPPKLIHAIRGDLDWIVMKSLEKDRARRYSTANGLAADIQRHLDNEPVAACPPSLFYRFKKLIRRNSLAFVAGTGVIVALFAALFTLTISNVRIRKERNQKDIATEAARASEQRAREQLFVSLQSQAEARRNSRRPGQRVESLAALAEAASIRPTEELRDHAIAAMAHPDIEQGPPWPISLTDMRSVAYDSGYQHYARLGTDGVISVRTIPGDLEIKRLQSAPSTRPGSAEGQLSFSPDDRCIARISESGKLEIWQWESGTSILKSPPGNCSGARAFSRDNRWFVAGHDNWITCFDLGTGALIRRWQARGRPYSIGFHPDNRTVAVSYSDFSMVSIYHAEDGGHVADLPTGADPLAIVAWHPEGNLLATAGSDPRIQIWDVPAQRQMAVLEGHVQVVNFLMFDWRGGMLASMGGDNVLRLWQPMPSRLLMKLTPRWVDPSRAGRWAGVVPKGNDRAQHWGIIPSQEYLTFLNPFSEGECQLREGDISADGSMLALGASDGVGLWDVAAGREIARLSMGDTTCVMFRNNDRELLTCGTVDGLRRWALVSDTGPEGGLQLGPFHQVKLPFLPRRMARGRDEGTLGVVGETPGQGVMLDLTTESLRVSNMTHEVAGFVGLSPDGKRLATGGWHSERVKLWDAPAGTLMKDLEVALNSRVFFTPDNRELIVARDNEFTFRTLDSLAVSRRLPRELGLYAGYVAFTADGKMMALEMAPGVIHLKDVASGRTVAKLEDPSGDCSTWMSFTPDGTQLIVAATYAGAIHRWDLRAIRERLKIMNLDWDWPAFPAVEPAAASRAGQRLRIRIIHEESP